MHTWRPCVGWAAQLRELFQSARERQRLPTPDPDDLPIGLGVSDKIKPIALLTEADNRQLLGATSFFYVELAGDVFLDVDEHGRLKDKELLLIDAIHLLNVTGINCWLFFHPLNEV